SSARIEANGGGGAGPQLGMPGEDGAPGPGSGGAGGVVADPPNVGGTGAFRDGNGVLSPATIPNPANKGGGGGGWGRIWVRTRGTAPDLTKGEFSPDALVDTTL